MLRWPTPRGLCLLCQLGHRPALLHTSAVRLRGGKPRPSRAERALVRQNNIKIWTKNPPFKKIRLHNRDDAYDDEIDGDNDGNDQKSRARRLDKLLDQVWSSELAPRYGVGHPSLLAELDPTGELWPAFKDRVRDALTHSPRTEFETELARHINAMEGSPIATVHFLRFAFIDDALAAQGFDFAKGIDNVPDTRNPTEWYPQARQVQRKIHLHVGPTNSGKTYHALKQLEAARTGYYAGPLRLLAHEVYSRFRAQGMAMDLITGDDVRLDDDPATNKSASTVEMVSLTRSYDVAVIDEIQMIADEDRGWAWTRAVLGSKAKELHLCGEERVVPLIEELAATMGDTLQVHRYQRLNPLRAQSRSLRGELRKLRKGDCVVSFSVVNIHALKKHIEQETGRHVAIVYGSLPPETRAQQAALFNDPDNDYDFLVASDAIGMGLNLSIKRIVFEGVTKFNGQTHQPISVSQLKQIAGRAGRYKSAPDANTNANANDVDTKARSDSTKTADTAITPGLVTCLDENDLPVIQKALNTDAKPIQHAGIMPPGQYLDEVASRLPEGLPFEYLLSRVCQAASTNPRHKICDIRAQLATARAIESVQGLDLTQRLALSAAPVDLRSGDGAQVLLAFATCIAQGKEVTIADVPEIPLETLDREPQFNKAYLGSLEVLHKAIILYCWLGYRFSYVFKDLDMAFHAKQMTEERINTCLSHFSADLLWRKRLERMKADLSEPSQSDPDDQASEGSESSVTQSEDADDDRLLDADREEAPKDEGQELDLAVEELLHEAESSAEPGTGRHVSNLDRNLDQNQSVSHIPAKPIGQTPDVQAG
ncbi:hypothetical protein DV738_g5207, partial [Chaetothyriales sp. CBS 135597]